MKRRFLLLAIVILGALLMLTACGDSSKIKIGSKDFTESLILGEMYALALEDAGFEVERKLNLGGTLVAHEAIKNGDIDIYPEYTGTGLLNIMEEEPIADPEEVYNMVNDYYQDNFDLEWLTPANANNTQAIAVSRTASEEYGIETISDLQQNAEAIDFAAVPEFEEREDGLLGLNRVYGDFNFKSLKLYDYGVKYRAVLEDEVQGTVAFGTDGELVNPDLVLLEDDKNLWPPYFVAPVVRQSILDVDDDVREILDHISSQLDDETVQVLNAEVDIEQREYADVAKEFLQDKEIIN